MTVSFSITQQSPETNASPCIVVGVYENHMLTAAAARVDEKSNGVIKRLLESSDITGKAASTRVLFGVPGIAAARVLVVGLGDEKTFDAAR
ncbi:MAG: M17 family peptidase N-terminal domain-containing protein, partial [Rudaea sp.]